MPLLPITSPSTIDACRSLPLRPTDTFICSYPKSGTTWTQCIVLTLLLADRRHRVSNESPNGSNAEKDLNFEHVSDFAPFYEIDAHWDTSNNRLADSVRTNHDRLNRRVFNTHLRWDMLPKEKDATNTNKPKTLRPACGKFIYVTRNLLDACASFYHHLSNQKEGTYTQSFDTFARDWMDGKVAFGSPLHHLLSFAEGFRDNHYEESNGDNTQQPLLLLSYRDLKSNLREQVLRIVEFLELRIPIDVLDNEILPTFEFQSMKDNSHRFQPKSVTWLNGFQFLRKGEMGDGRKLMEESLLLNEYEEWLEREFYEEKVKELLGDGDGNIARDVFLGVIAL